MAGETKVTKSDILNFGEEELVRYEGTVTSAGKTLIIPIRKHLRIEVRSVQNTTETNQQVLRAQFNGRGGASDYYRKYGVWSQTGALNHIAGTTSSVVVGIGRAQWQQSVSSMKINGTTKWGYNKIMWQFISDDQDWAYGFGHANLQSSNDINTMRLTVEGTATYNVEAIVYGTN